MSRPVDYKQLAAEAVAAVGMPLVDDGPHALADFGFALSLHCTQAMRINGTKRGDYRNDERSKRTENIAKLARDLQEEIRQYHGISPDGELPSKVISGVVYYYPPKAADEMIDADLTKAINKIEAHYSAISAFARYCVDSDDRKLNSFCESLANTYHKHFGKLPGKGKKGYFQKLVAFISEETGLAISVDTVQDAAIQYGGKMAQ
jgi:hypothetical protein